MLVDVQVVMVMRMHFLHVAALVSRTTPCPPSLPQAPLPVCLPLVRRRSQVRPADLWFVTWWSLLRCKHVLCLCGSREEEEEDEG